MTRKHFKALADVLKGTRPELTEAHPDALAHWETTMYAVASVCRSFNPNFNAGRFYAACNGTEG